MLGDPYGDRPASHAVHHASGEGPKCQCHGKTEAEIALPYALIALSLPVLALVGLIIAWITH